jgi:hypothetical protein
MKRLILFIALMVFLTTGIAFAVTNTFGSFSTGLKDPAVHAFAITPSDTTDMTYVTRKIWVGVGGAVDVTLITLGGETVTFKNVPSGTLLEIRATRVMSTGTGATYLLGLY